MKTNVRARIEERKLAQRASKIELDGTKREFARHPMIIVGLCITGFLTSLAGIFIGIAPQKIASVVDETGAVIIEGGIRFFANDSAWAAIVGIFFAVVYALVFPFIGEVGTYFWHRKAELRDPDNKIQFWIAYGMFGITLCFTTITAIAASVILASLLGTFDVFKNIPEWAQTWTVIIIPIGALMHSVANIFYRHVSEEAEESRTLERELQTAEVEAAARIKEARVEARKNMAISQAEEYARLSEAEAAQIGRARAKSNWESDKSRFGASNAPPELQERPQAPQMNKQVSFASEMRLEPEKGFTKGRPEE